MRLSRCLHGPDVMARQAAVGCVCAGKMYQWLLCQMVLEVALLQGMLAWPSVAAVFAGGRGLQWEEMACVLLNLPFSLHACLHLMMLLFGYCRSGIVYRHHRVLQCT